MDHVNSRNIRERKKCFFVEKYSVPADETKDFQLVLLPQNRRHQLQNVKFGNENRKGSRGRDSVQCKTSITFTYDGVDKQIPW